MKTSAVTPKVNVYPAPQVWNSDALVGELGHRAHFQKFGFTVVRQLLDAEQVALASTLIDEILSRQDEFLNVRVIGRRNPLLPSYDLENSGGTEAGAGVARKITGIRALSPQLADLLIEAPPLLDLLHLLLGQRVELYRDALMMKPAHIGQEKAWHQDAVYWPFRPMKLISAMIAVDKADPSNGCLQVVPATHHDPLLHQKIDYELQLTLGDMQRQALYVPLDPGDCLLFHSLLLHASEHNVSPQQRRVSICTYSPGGLTSLDPEQEPPLLISERGYQA